MFAVQNIQNIIIDFFNLNDCRIIVKLNLIFINHYHILIFRILCN